MSPIASYCNASFTAISSRSACSANREAIKHNTTGGIHGENTSSTVPSMIAVSADASTKSASAPFAAVSADL